jgi:hypothetical protein
LIDRHPEIRTLQGHLVAQREVGISPADDQEAVTRMRAARQAVGTEIKRRLGLVEERKPDEERAEEERLARLGEIQQSLTGEETDDELLARFGVTDGRGNMTPVSMQSPLFRRDTGKAFKQYMDAVVQYLAMERAEEMAGTRVRGTLEASDLRGQAHDAVSQMVAEDLGLPFADARRFVAKARDGIIPGSGERNNYANLVRGRKLAEEFGGDVAAFTRAALGDIVRRRDGTRSDGS